MTSEANGMSCMADSIRDTAIKGSRLLAQLHLYRRSVSLTYRYLLYRSIGVEITFLR